MAITYPPTYANPSPQLKAAVDLLAAGSEFDGKAVDAVTTNDYEHVFLPENANLGSFNKHQFISRVEESAHLFASFTVRHISFGSVVLRTHEFCMPQMNILEIIEASDVIIFHVRAQS